MKNKYYLRSCVDSSLLDSSCGYLEEVFTNKNLAKKSFSAFNGVHYDKFLALFDSEGNILRSALPNLVKVYREKGYFPFVSNEQLKAFGIPCASEVA